MSSSTPTQDLNFSVSAATRASSTVAGESPVSARGYFANTESAICTFGTPSIVPNITPSCTGLHHSFIQWIQSLTCQTIPSFGSMWKSLEISVTLSELPLETLYGPELYQIMDRQSLDVRLIHYLLFQMINDLSDPRDFEDLEESIFGPTRVLLEGLRLILALSPNRLNNLLDSIPTTYSKALFPRLLRYAVAFNLPRTVETLLKRMQSSKGHLISPERLYGLFGMSCRLRHEEVTLILLKYGAVPNMQSLVVRNTALILRFSGSIDFNMNSVWKWNDSFLSYLKDKQTEELSPTQQQILGLFLRREALFEHYNIDHMSLKFLKYSPASIIGLLVDHVKTSAYHLWIHHKALAYVLQRNDQDLVCRVTESVLQKAIQEAGWMSRHCNEVLTDCLVNATLNQNIYAVDLLLAARAMPDSLCLMVAIRKRDLRTIMKFLNTGLDARVVCGSAFRSQYSDDAMLADGILTDFSGSTPVSEAIKHRFQECIDLFKERGYLAKLGHSKNGLQSALLEAFRSGDTSLVDYFLSLNEDYLRFKIQIVEEPSVFLPLIDGSFSPFRSNSDGALLSAVMSRNSRLTHLILDSMPGHERFASSKAMLSSMIQWGDIEVLRHFNTRVSFYSSIDCDDEEEYGGISFAKTAILSLAILRSERSIVDLLLSMGAPARVDDDNGRLLTPLAAAVVIEDLDLLQRLLHLGADSFDNSAIAVATGCRNLKFVNILLEAFRTTYPSCKRDFGARALATAIRMKNLPLVTMLAKHADANFLVADRKLLKYEGSETPLGTAISTKHDTRLDMIRILLRNNADPNSIVYCCMGFNYTALIQAVEQANIAEVQELVRAGAVISAPAKDGLRRTPLQTAVEFGKEDILQYFLDNAADVNEPPAVYHGATALQLAAIKGYMGIADLLIKARADVNALPAIFKGRSAFEGATEHGRLDMMLFLVKHGADLLSNSGLQYRKAVKYAKKTEQFAAAELAEKLYQEAADQAVQRGLNVSNFGEGSVPAVSTTDALAQVRPESFALDDIGEPTVPNSPMADQPGPTPPGNIVWNGNDEWSLFGGQIDMGLA